MKTIIAVSAGHDSTKKIDSPIRKRIHYLNYGLLGLATILKDKGHLNVVVFQADTYEVNELFDTIETSGIDISSDCECFLLSIPSYYSISWSQRFCAEVKYRYNVPVIVGGRWVVDNHVDWVRNKLQYVDTIIEGFGAQKLSKFLGFTGWENIPDGRIKCFDKIDYTILHDYKMFQPCIEISRGCGAGCQFCADKDNSRLRNKPVSIIMKELDALDAIYERYSVYFEAPHFVFEPKWVNKFCAKLMSRDRRFSWRCTSRVESVPTSLLEIMSHAGLKVLDIGLESASYSQLVNMGKTKNPMRYLEKAESLLVECAKHDIWVKFNLLLYAGETHQTVSETKKWLIDHKDLIKDVSVSSLVYYYNMDSIEELQKLGASIPKGEDISTKGYINLDLSPEINYATAQKYAVEIPKLIANQRDFYDIKAISYFDPTYTYSDFLKDVEKCNLDDLPFSVETVTS